MLSLCYLLLRRVLQLAFWRSRSTDLKELEIAVVRHELAVLHGVALIEWRLERHDLRVGEPVLFPYLVI